MTRLPTSKILAAAALTAAALGAGCAGRLAWNQERGTVGAPSVDGTVGYEALQRMDNQASNPVRPLDSLPFIDLKHFERSWSAAQSSAEVVDGRIVAGVVNHHFLAADLLARFFVSSKKTSPETERIIIISPDHFRRGHAPVSTQSRPYSAPDGLLEVDASLVATLISEGLASSESSSLFETEHGIGTLVPFIKRAFPKARIVPLAIDGFIDRRLARDLGRRLALLTDELTVVIVSSDMSHYLAKARALENDQTTIDNFKTFDEGFFATAKDDFIDNGPGFLVLAGYLEAKGMRPEFILIDHAVSSDFGGNDVSTTSYINGFWIE